MIHVQLQDKTARLRQLSVDTLYTASQSLLKSKAVTVTDELTVTADARKGGGGTGEGVKVQACAVYG